MMRWVTTISTDRRQKRRTGRNGSDEELGGELGKADSEQM